MKTRTKKIILGVTAAALLLGAIGGGIGAALNTEIIETNAYYTPDTHYTNHDADTYYNSISDSLSGTDLLSALRTLNGQRRKKTMGYKTGGTSATNSDFIYTDYDTSNPSTIKTDSNGQPYGTVISSFYSYQACTTFNKEHVWPNTHGGNKVEADIHMARPTVPAENSNRGHSYYVENMAHSTNGWDPYYAFHLNPDPKTGDLGPQTINSRGEAARIVMYCMVASSSLTLEAGHSNSSKINNTLMGDLETILKWNLDIPVTERENNRNEGAEYLQGNRNPFIDHPEYACKIWGNTNSTTRSICGSQPTVRTLSSIAISGTLTKSTYYVGDTFNPAGLTVTATYSDGTTANVTSKVTWSPTKFNSVSSNASVTASYTEDEVTKTAIKSGITVKNSTIAVTDVRFDESFGGGTAIDEGSTLQLIYNVLPENATNKAVTFQSNDTSVATVSSTGLVKGIGSGTTTITVRSIDNASAYDTCTIEVYKKEVPVESIAFEQKEITLTAGATRTVSVEFTPSNATDKSLNYITSDISVATVTSAGRITAQAAGTATITATSHNAHVATLVVTVINKHVDVTGVKLDKTTVSIVEGDATNLIETVLPTNASNQAVTWKSDNEEVALVRDGEVSGISEGTATITVRTEDGNFTASCVVTVIGSEEEVLLSSIELSETKVTMDESDYIEIGVTFTPSNATNKDLIWESSDEKVATVNDATIFSHRPGTAVITATSARNSEITASIEVTVRGEEYPEIESIGLDIVNKTITAGESIKITATVLPENVYDDTVRWISSDSEVAIVGDDGTVVGISEGVAQITAYAEDKPEVIAVATIEVKPYAEIVHVKRVQLDFTSKELTVDDEFTLNATVLPEDATNKNVTWSVSNPEICTVTQEGKITAISAGTTSVKVTSQDNEKIYSTCTITVKDKSDIPDPEVAKLVELTIGHLPNKTTYKVGETFVRDGLVIYGHFTDGSTHEVTNECTYNSPITTVEGISNVFAVYKDSGVSVSFDIIILQQEIIGIQITKFPAKTEYFVGESLLDYGIQVVATLEDGKTLDITDIVTYDVLKFTEVGEVDIVVGYKEFSARFTVTVKAGIATAEIKANDFALIFNYKTADIETASVSATNWAMLKFYYSQLDDATKLVLQSATYSNDGVQAADPDQIEECVREYDAMYLAHKNEAGFDDFMQRDPQPASRNSDSNLDQIVFFSVVGGIVLITLIVVICVVASKKRRQKRA